MVSRAYTYAQLARLVYRVLNKLWRLWNESTPQEREAVRRNLEAIYEVLRNVAARGTESPDLPPMLMLPPPDVEGNGSNVTNKDRKQTVSRARRFRQNARHFVCAVGRYQSSFTQDDAKAVHGHLGELRSILWAIERRTRK
jgi:hypothetical protein